MKPILIVLLAAALGACASAGRPIDQAKVRALKVGETTIQQAENALGKPFVMTQLPDGRTLLEYMHATAQANGATFVPIVGLFASTVHTTSHVLILFFDAHGKLASVQTQASDLTSGPGAP